MSLIAGRAPLMGCGCRCQGSVAAILTEDVVVEVRYRTVTRTDSEGNNYDVEVPYNYYICYVTLENFNLSHTSKFPTKWPPS